MLSLCVIRFKKYHDMKDDIRAEVSSTHTCFSG